MALGGHLLVLVLATLQVCRGAEVIIHFPPDVASLGSDVILRLNYRPPIGKPPANFTFHPAEIHQNGITIVSALPGTEYVFDLFYSNNTVTDLLTWTASILTVPDPPANLSVIARSTKTAQITWEPPLQGGYTSFRLKVFPLTETVATSTKMIQLETTNMPFLLKDLTPGATYELQLMSMFNNKESLKFATYNLTTKPNAPGRFIVWFRNETTLLVLWQPPYPAGVFTQYKASIEPRDAVHSEVYVEKESGPAQADFNGLIPGRNYNITVQTVSEDQLSLGTSAHYRTVPSPPINVTFDRRLVRPDSFTVVWEPPKMPSEFERYHVSLGIRLKTSLIVDKDNERIAMFTEGLEPGKTYEVVVKTVSGNVASWPTTGNVTTRPLPVTDVNSTSLGKGAIHVSWRPNNASSQDSYKVFYQDVETYNDDGGLAGVTKDTSYNITGLLHGHNYSIIVVAVSNHMESEDAVVYQATLPKSPIIEVREPMRNGLNISWKSDVTSRQDSFEVVYIRNDTGEKNVRLINEDRILLTNLYAGATYDVKVFAISYGLKSEPHAFDRTVYPNAPNNLTIFYFENTTVHLHWMAPTNSLYDYYTIKYKGNGLGNTSWQEYGSIYNTSFELPNLIPGNKYNIAVYSVSYKIESIDSAKVELALRPTSVSKVEPILDSQNITFTWESPSGFVEHYLVIYSANSNPSNKTTKQLPGNSTKPGGTKHIIINNLFPGELYTFHFYAVSHGARSEPYIMQTRTMPLILSDVTPVISNFETHNISLRYTLTPSEATIFDHYRFQLSDPSIPPQERAQNNTHRYVTFTDLTPGRLYNINIWTVSGDVLSKPIHRQDRLYPESITDMNATKITDTEITLVWNPPRGDYTAYEVQYFAQEVGFIQNLTQRESITFSNLKPHKNYTFTVVVLSGTDTSLRKRSMPFSKDFKTLEATPGKVQYFRAKDVKPNEITLQWSLPDVEQNGILVGYTISYRKKDGSKMETREFAADDTFGTLSNLEPGQTYIFMIQGKTKIGHGPKVSLEETLPIWPPPTPSPQFYPSDISKTTNTIRIRFQRGYFSTTNGPIVSYTIIVAEDYLKDSSNLDLPSWQEVQSQAKWPPYQVVEPYNPFINNSAVEEFLIGAGGCLENSRYCNGPLKSGTSYRIKVRAFTARDKFTDTSYSPIVTTEKDNTSVIVIAVLVPMFILIATVIAILLLRRRRQGPFMKKTSKRNIPGKEDSLSIPESVIETSRPVKLKDFPEHFRLMSADSDFRFSEEYEELKMVGRDLQRTAADLPVNRPKNRFTNILPYDHSRVKLLPTDDEDGSDYINANYVSGYNSPREFIVTQGPLHSTRDDLWRMIWEQNSRAVVMLTRCIEKGREKCDHYWPYDTQPTYYGDIQVTILNESQYPDWTISEFKVCRGDHSRIVRHFHFTTWPDFGVPDPPQTLIRFVRAFRERIPPDQKPIVVHCSAGVGRSGTFIALDRILQHIQTHDYVDIFGIVYEMRKERVWMVQTEQQYICIHQCLLCVLEGRENENPPRGEVHENEGFEDDEGIAESGM